MTTPIDSALMTTLGELDHHAEKQLIQAEPIRIATGQPIEHETLGRGVIRIVEDRFVTIDFTGLAGRQRCVTSMILPLLREVRG